MLSLLAPDQANFTVSSIFPNLYSGALDCGVVKGHVRSALDCRRSMKCLESKATLKDIFERVRRRKDECAFDTGTAVFKKYMSKMFRQGISSAAASDMTYLTENTDKNAHQNSMADSPPQPCALHRTMHGSMMRCSNCSVSCVKWFAVRQNAVGVNCQDCDDTERPGAGCISCTRSATRLRFVFQEIGYRNRHTLFCFLRVGRDAVEFVRKRDERVSDPGGTG